MSTLLVTLINITGNMVIVYLAARWYVVPRFKSATFAEAVTPLLLLNMGRHIGLMFLSSDIAKPGMPQAFAEPAAYGDLLAALLAGVALLAVRANWRSARLWVWVFNIIGFADFLVAVTQGILNDASAFMGPAYWIPVIAVPVLFISHILIFQLLVNKKTLATQIRH